MKWILTSITGALVHEFHLLDKETELMSVKINPLHQSVRMKAGTRRRLVFLENGPTGSGKLTLHDEYGMELGNMLTDKWYNNRGNVTIDNSKYYFQQNGANKTALAIYKTDIDHALLTCELASGDEPASFHPLATETDNHCIMLALCWYAGLPALSVIAPELSEMHY